MHFITVTRKLGAGGTEIARSVAERLGYTLLDTEAVEAAARELGFLDDVREIDEKPPSIFRSLFSQKPAVELARLTSVVYELARGGDAVFVGRGSHILLKSFRCALHVRVTASRETRIRTLVARGYHQEAASAAVDRSDHERAAFIRFAFGADWDTSELYDLVINTDTLTVAVAVETIVQIARSEEIRSRSLESLGALEAQALASRAEAALMESGLLIGARIMVAVTPVDPGKVQLTGILENPAARAKAEAVVGQVKGVREVDNQIRVVPVGRFA